MSVINPWCTILFLSLGLLLFSCTGKTSTSELSSQNLPEARQEASSPPTQNHPWAGTYFGLLPFREGDGIETRLRLSEDSTFTLHTEYHGRNDALEEEFTGKIVWEKSASETRLTLVGKIGGYPSQYLMQDSLLIQLDTKGQKIEGPLAERYWLKRIK
jgi:hypothetical protein